ncbi:MAG: LysR family transcriptional regulator [Rubrobacteraceae bacterium]
MDIRQLKYFVAVAEERHFGRAARRLHMSQPPLSTQIKGLETELGVRLLDRSTRRVSLTDAGRVFLRRANEILNSVDAAAEEVQQAESGLRGRLTVGFISSATLSLLPLSIRLFRERFGGVELELKELTSSQQVDELYEGGIRVGLVRLPMNSPGIRLEPVLEESLVVALPAGHALAMEDRISLEAMSDQPLVFFTRALVPGFHAQIVELYARVGAFPNVVQHAVHFQTIVGLVASGIGSAILPESAQRVTRDGVVYRPLDTPDATSWVALATLEGDNSLLVENFARVIRDVARCWTFENDT